MHCRLAKVFGCGWNAHNQLGFEDRRTRRALSEVTPLEALDVRLLSAGVIHSVAVSCKGELWGWGYAGTHGLGKVMLNEGGQ